MKGEDEKLDVRANELADELILHMMQKPVVKVAMEDEIEKEKHSPLVQAYRSVMSEIALGGFSHQGSYAESGI